MVSGVMDAPADYSEWEMKKHYNYNFTTLS